jgi:hypothetical protein
MSLPKIKTRQGRKFELINEFNSNIDARRELKKIKNENALFGKRLYFLFESKNPTLVFKNGIYEQFFSI